MTGRFTALAGHLRRRRPLWILPVVVIAGLFAVGSAVASHFEASLEGSKFEIDNNANLVRNSSDMTFQDWATIGEGRTTDKATGANDDSYSGGAKEDDTCPPVGTGSIPNNKSDLRHFGIYEEPGSPGFMHLFWTRVQDPSGTTLMDFELNQSSATCANGVNRVRTVDDLLIEYRIEQGGARAEIKVRKWTGSAWGAAQDLTAQGAATGTINSTAIAAGNADGLGALSARTFGEASLDLKYIFQPGKCLSFGSAFLKSRASDSFTSQLKDYIGPQPVSISNCGKVIIRKVTDPAGGLGSFGFTDTLATDPARASHAFSLGHGQSETISNVLFGTGYTVTESQVVNGYELSNIDCSASTGVTPATSVANAKVTFDIDNENDVVDCTFTNRARGTLVVKKETDPSTSTATFAFSGEVSGSIGHNGTLTKANLAPGSGYSVAETVPTGWDLTAATCDRGTPSLSGSTLSSITIVAGQTTTCTFKNRQRGSLKVEKVTDPASDTTTAFTFNPTGFHGGAAFNLVGGASQTFADLVPGGSYSVSEAAKQGWDLTSATCTKGTPASITIDPGQQTVCTFTNRKRATLEIVKVDDAGSDANPPNRLNGAQFTLYTDANGQPGSPVGAGIANPNACTTAGTGGAAGQCSITGITPGTYWVVETQTPAGYETADPVKVTLTAGQTVQRTIIDPRKHKVIVLVCHMGTDTLTATDVVNGTSTKTSLSGAGLTREQQAALCGLGGASWDNLSHGDKTVTAKLGSSAHP